jgi:flagellar hook capping protein FlgD
MGARFRGAGALLAGLLLGGGPVAGAAAGWPAGGARLCDPPCQPLDYAVIAADGDGGAFAAWLDRLPHPARLSLRAQRVSGLGARTPGWPAAGAPVDTSGPVFGFFAASPNSAGGMLAAWRSQRMGSSIFVQRLSAGGEPVAGWPDDGVAAVIGTVGPSWPYVVPDREGGGYVVWQDRRKGIDDEDAYLQRIGPGGAVAAGWPANGVPACSAPRGQFDPVPVPDLDGVIVAWWDDRDSTRSRIFATRFDPDGQRTLGWPADGVALSGGSGYALLPTAIPLSTGGAVVAWNQQQGADVPLDVYVQRVFSNGVLDSRWPPQGRWLGYGVLFGPSLAPDDEGGAYVAWTTFVARGSERRPRIRLQRVVRDGVFAPGWPDSGLELAGDGDCYARALVTDGQGGVIVVSESWQVTDSRVHAQRVTAAGTVAPGWPARGALLSGLGTRQCRGAVSDGAGGALVLMSEGFDPASLVVQRVTGAGVVAPGWSGYPSTGLFDAPYPNPAAGTALVSFALPSTGPARVQVFDAGGRLVRTLLDVDEWGPGRHELAWEGRDQDGAELPAGIYLVRIQAGSLADTRRIVRLR